MIGKEKKFSNRTTLFWILIKNFITLIFLEEIGFAGSLEVGMEVAKEAVVTENKRRSRRTVEESDWRISSASACKCLKSKNDCTPQGVRALGRQPWHARRPQYTVLSGTAAFAFMNGFCVNAYRCRFGNLDQGNSR